MSWIVPENKLDAQQRDFIDNVDITRKNVWIKGFPGSGKSVLLAHTIRKIKVKDGRASILVVVFTHSLIKMFEAAFAEMGYRVDVVTFYDFMKSSRSYDYILSDEVQDLTPTVLRAMNSRAKHVVVAGDSNQSIYDMDPRFREETVSPSQINSLLSSRDFELGIIHRLSSSIINAVQKFLPRLNIFSAKRDLTKQTTQVRLCEAHSSEEEVKYILREAKKAVNVGQTAGVLIPTQDKILDFIQAVIQLEGKQPWEVQTNNWGRTDYSALNRYLASKGIPLQYVGNGYGQFSDNSNKICVMTYHSSKGLDFDNVFLPYLNNSLFIVSDETLSKTLFMVAMTRSRNNLYLTYSGYKHAYLNNFAADCNKIDIHDALNVQQQKFDGGSVFAGF
jgi:superfamily I DNA/RNA helicase